MNKLLSLLALLTFIISSNLTAQVDDGIVDLTIPCVSGMQDDIICLPIIVNDFENISFAQIPIQWDETQLEFVEVKSEFFPGSIFVPNQEFGTLRCVFQDPTLNNPLECEDGTAIFEVCFKVLVPGPVTAFVEIKDITDVPPPYPTQIIDADGYDKEFETFKGGIAINYNKIAFCVDEPNVSDSQACFSLKTANFNNVQTFQFSLDYDPSTMYFSGATQWNFDINFNTAAYNEYAPGNIRISWFTSDGTGRTLDDGALIAQFCFNDVVDSMADLVIGNNVPGGIEATDANNDFLFLENNCDGLTNVFEVPSYTLDFTISPNPAENHLLLSYNSNNSYSYSIINKLGQVVIPSKSSNSNTNQIDIQFLSKGIYFVRIEDGSEVGVQKFVKL